MKSVILNLLKPSGPDKPCTGIALPLLYIKNIKIIIRKLRPNSLSSLLQDIWLTLEHQLRGLSRISHEGWQGRLSRTQFQYSKTILNKKTSETKGKYPHYSQRMSLWFINCLKSLHTQKESLWWKPATLPFTPPTLRSKPTVASHPLNACNTDW